MNAKRLIVITVSILALVAFSMPALAADVTIKLATGTPKTHPQDRGALFFADMVKQGVQRRDRSQGLPFRRPGWAP